jgi:hypothetical protein
MRRVWLFTLLATFAFTLPASAARYQYNLESGPPDNTSGPFLPFPTTAFSFSWQSDHLIASPQCPAASEDISKLPGFSGPMLSGTGAAAYTFVDIVLVCALQPEFLPLQIRVDWNVATPSGLCVSQPPFTLPFYVSFLYSQIGPGTLSISGSDVLFSPPGAEPCLGIISYFKETVTVTDTWSAEPPPGPVCLHCRKHVSIRFVEGPVAPLPGGPVEEATVQLTTLSGEPASPVRRVTLTPGRISSVDFPPDDRRATGTFEDVVPAVKFVSAPATLPAVQITTESFDARTGEPNGPLITSGISVPPSTLASQSLGHGETLRLIARATSPNACIATLSFSDAAGNRIGPTASVNLPAGEAQTLELTLDSVATAASLRADKRIEILPAVQLTRSLPAASAAPIPSVCSATAEVFNSETGVIATYQNAFLE